MQDGRERLRSNPYPGRGIVIGLDTTGTLLLQLYWITGRSAGSKNRILVIDGSNVRTQPFDETGRTDDPNIYYRAIAEADGHHVVTNGNHTETIVEHVTAGSSFAAAMETAGYETDAPNFTPRIAGIAELSDEKPVIALARAYRGPKGETLHHLFEYRDLAPGTGYCIHTYAADGNPVPAFTGEPFAYPLRGSPEEAAAALWNLLPSDRRVALAVKAIGLATQQSVAIAVRNALG